MSRKGLLLALLGVALISAVAGEASAHANYVSSNPAAGQILPRGPANVTVTLSEQIERGQESIRVTNSNGTQVDLGNTEVSPTDPFTMSVGLEPIGPGIYTATWNAVSAVDGHFTTGSFSFAVANPDGSLPGPLPSSTATSGGAPVSPVEVVLRDANFSSLVGALGLASFGLLVWDPAGRGLDGSERPAYEDGRTTLLRWERLAFLAFLVATGVWLAYACVTLHVASLGDVGSSSLLMALVVEAALGGLAAVLLSRQGKGGDRAKASALTRPFAVTTFLGLAIVAVGSFATHGAAAVAYSPAGLIAEGVHLAVVAAWVGGLAAIVIVRKFIAADRAQTLGLRALKRFSRLAGYAVAAILGTGIVLGVLLVGSWSSLFGTDYGWVVLGKVSLFAPMVALGAFNRLRLQRTAQDKKSEVRPAAAVAKNVKTEAVLGAVVLALAALLTSISPGATTASAAPQTFELSSTTQGLRFDFSINPYPETPGVYTFVVLVYNAADGSDYNGVRNATLTFTLTNSTLPPQTVPLLGPHGNHLFVISPALSRPGTWRIDLLVTRYNAFDIEVPFNVAIHAW